MNRSYKLLPHPRPALTRRALLSCGAAVTLSTLSARPALHHGEVGAADALILLWMAGGMPHTETFDPKPPPMNKRAGDDRSISTTVGGVRISKGLERIAGLMNRATLVRSVVGPDLGFADHGRYREYWLRGFPSPQYRLGGEAGNFGRSCEEALRLVERGAHTVMVCTPEEPFHGWDTHARGVPRAAEMKRMIDTPVADLVLGLERKNLLGRTLVVLASEFSRCSRGPDLAGPHEHFTGAGSALLFGGGATQGRVHGRTSNKWPYEAVEEVVRVDDIHDVVRRAMLWNG